MHTILLESVYKEEHLAAAQKAKSTTVSAAVLPNGEIETSTGKNMRSEEDDHVQQHAHSIVPSAHLTKLRSHHTQVRDHYAQALARQTSFIEENSTADIGEMEHSKARAKAKARVYKSWAVDYDGIISLKNVRDSQYIGPVGVGSLKDNEAESQIRVVFDSGSTNLWIASSYCVQENCKERHRYDPEESVTYRAPEVPVHLDITFGTGELRGPQGIDNFHVGPYIVANQTFGLIKEELGQVFKEIPFEGILGLAFPSMSARHVKPFFDTIMEQNVLSGKNEFSFYMTKLPDQDSAIFFGGVDERFFEGDIRYFPVTQEHYWSIDLVDFKIGDVSHVDFMEVSSEGMRVNKLILDTGTTYFTAPPGVFNEVLQRLPSTVCSQINTYPTLHYTLKDADGEEYTLDIPPSVYMVSTYGDGWCDPAFMEIPVPDKFGPAFIFGEVFMRHWYTVFNRGDGSEGAAAIGFAKAKHDVEAAKSLHSKNPKKAYLDSKKAKTTDDDGE